MNEKPIIFSAPMVRAILDGRKTQTRRVITPQPRRQLHQLGALNEFFYALPDGSPDWSYKAVSRYGVVGDRLWVRETWARHVIGAADHVVYRADCGDDGDAAPWRPSIHMPRTYSRITLEITGVRVERVQDISLDDIRAEGVRPDTEASILWRETLARNFIDLWDSINAKRGYGWDVNPWVWALTFRKVTP